ncbi:styrene monooxygenase/indole monooxygenase family protein [Nocardia pneumoniae]|uniref:styrene monooxygenase/indole monooxygenase family protein n=1 Tax=Nocardia pneumoniae TaxID=228601 RepID=UPI00068422AA|nr:styrene monooxygenase/indole monooxygenase family protein [Nocardia pneumoniae]
MRGIGIVGMGISALHLALLLQQRGIPTTLYADKTPEQIRDGRLPNNVCRFGRTRARERELGIDHWNFTDFGMRCAHVRVGGDPPIAFCAHLTHEASYVDFRIYLPQLLADYRERGGQVVAVPDADSAVAAHAADHDLVVVASGRQGVDTLFPRDASRSADHPSRFILAGFFTGVAHTDPMGMHFEIAPGAGEIFQTPVYALTGRVAGITFEALPDGPWAQRVRNRYYDDPHACAQVVLELLRESDSEILDRIDRRRFALTRPLDLLQGSITGTVRTPWTRLGPDTYAVAVGDAAVLNDPVTGQGANLAVAAAWELGRMIEVGPAFDEHFCHEWETRLWDLARDVTEWTQSALGPPPDHVMEVFRAAQHSQRLADAFLDNFDNPKQMWGSMATARRAAEFIRRATGSIDASDPDSAVVDRELRLLDSLRRPEDGTLDALVAADGVLVTAEGCHPKERWHHAAAPVEATDHPADVTVVPMTDTAQLVTYRHGTWHCSTLWRRENDTWTAVVHHRSPSEEIA